MISLLVRSVVGLCFDNTSSRIILETGRFNVSLFLALHSYFPLSLHTADFIVRSDLRLEKTSKLSYLCANQTNCRNSSRFRLRFQLKIAKFQVRKFSYRKWTKMYFVLFLFIDRPSLNHVTFGAGSPSTLHTIRTRLPSLTVKLGDIDSIEARLPAKEMKRKKKHQ